MSHPSDPTPSWDPLVARLEGRRAAHEAAAAELSAVPVSDPRGGLTTVDAALTRMAEIRQRISDTEDAGSEYHQRVSRGQRWLRRLLPPLDGLVLLWFLAGVLNADLRAPDVTVLVAVALALLCTVVVAAWTVTVGEHLQRYKDARRNLVWGAVDGLGVAMLALTAVICGLLAATMYVRVSDEIADAIAVPGVGGTVVALTLAAAVVLVNGYVLYLSFSDGSSLTRELDQLGRGVAPHLRRRGRDRARAAGATRRIQARLAAQERLHRPVDGRGLRVLPSVRSGDGADGDGDDESARAHHWWV